jgi:hypothetical protein
MSSKNEKAISLKARTVRTTTTEIPVSTGSFAQSDNATAMPKAAATAAMAMNSRTVNSSISPASIRRAFTTVTKPIAPAVRLTSRAPPPQVRPCAIAAPGLSPSRFLTTTMPTPSPKRAQPSEASSANLRSITPVLPKTTDEKYPIPMTPPTARMTASRLDRVKPCQAKMAKTTAASARPHIGPIAWPIDPRTPVAPAAMTPTTSGRM